MNLAWNVYQDHWLRNNAFWDKGPHKWVQIKQEDIQLFAQYLAIEYMEFELKQYLGYDWRKPVYR